MEIANSFSIQPHAYASLVVMNDDGSDLLRLEADGTVSGDLAERYPEAVPALAELGARIKTVMSMPSWG
jgi:hypothetical protein